MPRKFDFLSPGIEIREVDQSILPSEVDADGPVIIGRFRKGPGMKPAKVRSLDYFVQTYGNPVPGGSSLQGDVWRDGPQLSAPTYAAYAAQAWLASRTSPVNLVRLLGDQHPQAVEAGYAGWQLSASVPSSDAADNSTAYGLFIANSGSNNLTGTLAAVFYCDSGYMTLSGSDVGGTSVGQAATLVASVANNFGFKLNIHGTDSVIDETISFNFDRNSADYIRNKFNTNPQKTNSDVTDTADIKAYWLGESFERNLKDKVSSATYGNAGKAYGTLVALQRADNSAAAYNWSYHRIGSQEAKTGWIIDYDNGATGSYSASNMTKLFRFESLHAGEEIQKEILIAIEDLKLATNATIYPYGTFTVKVMNMAGGTLEKYSGCNLDPNSPNFIARRIGDMYMEWSETDRRYRSYGNHMNVSDYIRIKMYDEEQNYKSTALPFGFYGPGRPKGFNAISNSAGAKAYGADSAFSEAFVVGSGSIPGCDSDSEFIEMGTVVSASFTFPSMTLRKSGSDGYSANPYKTYFGIRPKVDSNSSMHDEDYVDYVRMLPSTYLAQAHNVTDDGFEYSFIFSLDDIVIDENLNTVVYTEGSRTAGTSYTATSGSSALLDKDVKQFVMPLFGGFDGMDIKYKEPMANELIGTGDTDTTNYIVYSLNKALDSISDPETVPASLLVAPGYKKPQITDKVIRVAESRKDMLAVIDLENDYTPSYESRDSQSQRLGSVTSTISSIKNRQINSSYACAYYPAVQIQDNLNNGERIWVPSSVAGVGAMAQSDASSDLWFAPAGFNRGGLGNLGGRSGPRVLQARQRLDASERDKLYEVNINPIATFPNEGVVVFGQKTLQQTPSALDRINVRRLMIYLKAEISKVAQTILFDNNVRSTWARFKSQAEPILEDVQSKFGLTEYRLILDGTTTTPDLIDRNIMYAKVFLKPARAIEFIAIDFVITRTGAEFA